jgi:hypothetical protein
MKPRDTDNVRVKVFFVLSAELPFIDECTAMTVCRSVDVKTVGQYGRHRGGSAYGSMYMKSADAREGVGLRVDPSFRLSG